MKPNISELFFASRYLLPLWALSGLWLWSSGEVGLYWQRLDESGRAALVFVASMTLAGVVTGFRKVWAYERAKWKEAAAWRESALANVAGAVCSIYSRLRVWLQNRRRRLMLRLLLWASKELKKGGSHETVTR